ncbi:uncharacterized protein LOC126376061 [Pectinophora gossypiella]|uniref:uncharacterized protein LOC126376061 n=1 Tax=Pectinophora gossypiella TaxID=13191 RepID=UPI00214E80A0|nr:uncharacterized protein LOC126376061 [Pectinophora gossypiella]
MSLKAYEDACTRAELFGQPLPDREEFLARHKHLDVVEFEEVEIKTAENTAMLDDGMKEASGGLAELNTILTSTQTKINKLKGVCGSLTNFFRVKLMTKDNLSYSSDPSYVGQTNYDRDYVPSVEVGSINDGLGPNDNEMTPRAGNSKKDGGDIMSALDDLHRIQKVEDTAIVSTATVKDIGKQITSQTSRLDQMLNQADRAEASLQHQNKQMRTFLR